MTTTPTRWMRAFANAAALGVLLAALVVTASPAMAQSDIDAKKAFEEASAVAVKGPQDVRLANLATLRSIVWFGGVGCTVALFVVSA